MSRLGIFYSLSVVFFTVCNTGIASEINPSWVILEGPRPFTNTQKDHLDDIAALLNENKRPVFFSCVKQLSSKITKHMKEDDIGNAVTVFIAEELLTQPNLPSILKRIRYCSPYLNVTEDQQFLDFHKIIKIFGNLEPEDSKKIGRFVRNTVATGKIECASYAQLLEYIDFFKDNIKNNSVKWYAKMLRKISRENPLSVEDFKKLAQEIDALNQELLSPGQSRMSMLSSSLESHFYASV